MDLIMMRPSQLREAVRVQTPVLVPLGAYEYHGEHLPLGTDTLIAQGLCRRISEKTSVITAPAFPFSQTFNWAGGIDDGDINFPADALLPYAVSVLGGLVDLGFKRIYIMIGHQGKDGAPAAIFRYAQNHIKENLAKGFETGWGRFREIPKPEFFNQIRLCAYDEFIDYGSDDEHMPIGHAGRGETQLVMALYEGLVDIDAKQPRSLPFWLEDFHAADREDGEHWINLCVEGWVRHLTEN